MSNIKKLKEFSLNEEFNIGGFFSGMFDAMGEGFKGTIKTKLTASLLEKLGLEEGSLLSSFVQNFVTEIPMRDYPRLLSGDSTLNSTYWAPKLADSLRRFVEQKGIDTIAGSMGIKPTGLAFTFFRNMILSKKGQADITKAFETILGTTNVTRDAINNLEAGDKEKLANALTQRMSQSSNPSSIPTPQTNQASGGVWGALTDVVKAMQMQNP